MEGSDIHAFRWGWLGVGPEPARLSRCHSGPRGCSTPHWKGCPVPPQKRRGAAMLSCVRVGAVAASTIASDATFSSASRNLRHLSPVALLAISLCSFRRRRTNPRFSLRLRVKLYAHQASRTLPRSRCHSSEDVPSPKPKDSPSQGNVVAKDQKQPSHHHRQGHSPYLF